MPDHTLLVTSGDNFGNRARALAACRPDVILAEDSSSNIGRVVRLVQAGRLSPSLVARMAWAEWRRPYTAPTATAFRIRSNDELLRLLEHELPKRVVLFRAGLVINRDVLATGIPFLNIHCARIPEFGGLGSIAAALRAGAFDQCATLHRVTAAIDRGEVLMTEPYRLNPSRSYGANEDAAYEAGLRLLHRFLLESLPDPAPMS